MAVGVVTEYPGVTRKQDDKLSKAMGLTDMPAGELIHVCGPTKGGRWIMEVWESEEACEHSVTEVIVPGAQQGGFPSPATREALMPYHALALVQSR